VNSTIRNNFIWNNGALGGGAINLDGVSQSFIYNNVLYNNLAGGIVNFATDGVNPGSNVIIHNTIYNANHYGIALHDTSDNNIVGNNILITDVAIHYAIDVSGSGSGNNIDYNAVYVPNNKNLTFTTDGSTGLTPAQWAAAGYGSHVIVLGNQTSLFVNAAGNNYAEASGAPTIQAGNIAYSMVNGAVVPDINGVGRSAGNVDMGAYQFFDTSSTTASNSNSGSGSSSSSSAPRNKAELFRLMKSLFR